MKLPRTKNLRFGQLVVEAVVRDVTRISKLDGSEKSIEWDVANRLWNIPDSELEKLLTNYLKKGEQNGNLQSKS